MFGLSFSELVMILVVGVLMIGPEDLPRALRSVGKFLRGLSSLGQEMRRQMEDLIGDEEIEELKKLRESIQGQRKFMIDQQGTYQEVFDIEHFMKEGDASAQANPPVSIDTPHAAANEMTEHHEEPVMKPLPAQGIAGEA